MCGDAIRDFFEDAAISFVGGTPTPDNFTTLDDGDVPKPQTRLEELKDAIYVKNPSGVMLDHYANDSFETVHKKFSGSSPAGHQYIWGNINKNMIEALQKFRFELAALKSRDESDGWRGATRDAAIENVELWLKEPAVASGGAGAMEILVAAFSEMLRTISTHIHGNWANYQSDLKKYPEYEDEVKNEYKSFAQKVMRDIYAPGILEIGKNNPAFTQGGTASVGPELGGGGPGGGLGVGPGGGPGPFGSGSFGGPKIPDFGGPKIPDFGRPTVPHVPSPIPTRPNTGRLPGSGLDDPVRASSDAAQNALRPAADAAQNALGPAADAANQAAGGAQNAAQGRPPEGVLGLGPKGLGGAGGGGKPGGGAGATPPRGLASGRAVSTPTSAMSNVPSTATRAAAAGAGLGAMGPPGAGAPMGGQRGGENNAYTANKALRRKKNGQKIAGEADAVVAVVGAPERRPAAEVDQPDQPDRSEQPDRAGGGVRAAPWAARSPGNAKTSV